MLWEEGWYPGAIGITSIRSVPLAGPWKWAPGGGEGGRDIGWCPLQLSSEGRLDCGVVSPLQAGKVKWWREARDVPRKHLRGRRRDCARGEPSGAGSLALCQSTEERPGDLGVRWVDAGTAQGAWHRLWHC